MLFFLSPSHIAAPPAKGLTNHIESGLPFVAPAPITFVRSSFSRASTATRVNATGLIEVVPADTPRYDPDPVTLAPKGLLLEEAMTNLLVTNQLNTWGIVGLTITPSTDFPIFDAADVFLLTANGQTGPKYITRAFTPPTTMLTRNAFLRRVKNNVAQLSPFREIQRRFAIFNLLTGQLGSKSADEVAAITPWRDGWYRFTMTTISTANK